MDYIVRADYYPNGKMIPLAITDCHGISLYVRRIEKIVADGEMRYVCSMSNYERYSIVFRENTWYVKRISIKSPEMNSYLP